MARKCFEYRGYQLQSLNGQACAVRNEETGRRTRVRLRDAFGKPVPILNEAAARTALMAYADRVHKTLAGGTLSVGAIWDLFISDKEADKKPVEHDKTRWQALAPWFSQLLPEQVTDAICRGYAESRFAPCVEIRRQRGGKMKEVAYPNGRAPDTVWTELIVLQAALSWGLRKGHWSWPNKDEFMLWRPARSSPRERVLSREESERLIECAKPDSHIRLFIMIATFTGARKSAILELTWDQVDLDTGVIDFRSPKAIDPMSKHYRKGRAVVLMTATLRAVMKHYKARARTKFVVEYCGQSVEDVKGGFNEASRRAGLYDKTIPIRDRVTPHTLRHTVATWLDEEEVEDKAIQALLGHAPGSKVTRTNYIAKQASQTKGAAEKLESRTQRLRVVK